MARRQSQIVHTVNTGEQIDQLNGRAVLPISFELYAKRNPHISFKGSQGDALSIWTTQSRSGFYSRPNTETGLITLRFIDEGVMSHGGSNGKEIEVGSTHAMLTSFDEMRYERASLGFSAIAATISRDSIISACRALGGADATILPLFNAAVSFTSVGLIALQRTVRLLRDQLPETGAAMDFMTPLLHELLLFQLVSAWPTITAQGTVERGPDPDRPVRLAVDYIEANVRRKTGIADIASASGISVRTLQMAFKRKFGYSPIQYLIARRLDEVHAALQSDDQLTVGQVARHWGFTHMSDFTKRYCDRFGQTPARARRSA